MTLLQILNGRYHMHGGYEEDISNHQYYSKLHRNSEGVQRNSLKVALWIKEKNEETGESKP